MNMSIRRIGGNHSTPDFLKSEILINGTGIADGVTQLVMLVRLLNSDGSVVVGHRPAYQVASGLALADTPCSISDQNGISVCLLTASLPGIRTLRIVNLGQARVESGVTFIPPGLTPPARGFVASANTGTTASGHQVRSSVGVYHTGIRYRSPQGYTVYSSVQGELAK
ncbi:MAG: hypothetical protein NDI61_03810 [Bdellovibrionaceae bacterium]|nr:hypothetical protein [Pseudobdellovibrionaceae bacterium]